MKTLNNFLVLISALSLLLFSACKKDKNTVITITGTVNNANGVALSGVLVTANASGATATTSAQGTYSIESEESGTLTFSLANYQSLTEDVNSRTTINVTLGMSPAYRFEQYFATAGNTVANPSFAAGTITPTANLGALSAYPATFFTNVTYKGAINPSGAVWYAGWSFYDRLLAGATSDVLPSRPTKVITDASMASASDTIRWTNDTTYILSGFVFVEDGEVLDIEEGTIVQGRAGTGASASALIVARGGKILAEGTANEPIIFTYEGDAGHSAADLRGQWGGLLLLGKATLNSSPGQTAIEGIPTTETRGLYGGSVDTDNSGVLRYVSIRHGGTNIGADNEINGLTLAGVGSGTTIEYVEIVGNNDDGIEWFGGTVNAKYIISAYNADDAFDYDEGYRGKNQFVVAHQDATTADRGGEHDGGTNPETATPYATPVFYNATFVGNPASRTLTFRDNAGGEYHNSIFINFNKGVDIEDIPNQEQDSYKQFLDGNLKLENNVFYNITAGTSASALFKVVAP